MGRTSGHPLSGKSPAERATRLSFSPYLDTVTLDFARALIRAESVGRGPAPDLLAVSLSATDLIGHLYGPHSHEAHDALARLDADLGRFLGELEQRFGRDGLLVALTSDHGVLPLPEWLEAQGEARCPVPGGRTGIRRLGLSVLWKLHWRFSRYSTPGSWLHFAGSKIGVDRARAQARDVAVEEVVAAAKLILEQHPAIAKVWTPDEIRDGQGEMARLFRNSFDPLRGGDAVVQLEPGCLLMRFDQGTTHGTPYDYDRAVPLAFWGAGIAPARVPGRVATVDVAPTLARRLGAAAPAGLDGRVLLGPEAGP